MQIYRKLAFILILVIFVFTGCDLNTLPTQKAKILIGGGPGSEFCLFDIKVEMLEKMILSMKY